MIKKVIKTYQNWRSHRQKLAVGRGYVSVTCKDGNPRTAQVSIDGVVIPVMKAVVTLEVGEFTRVELEAYAKHLDIEALQDKTQIKIIKP
jgi:hypothetical protein